MVVSKTVPNMIFWKMVGRESDRLVYNLRMYQIYIYHKPAIAFEAI